MQTAPSGTYKGMIGCAGDIIKNEGPLAFYKVVLVSVMFTWQQAYRSTDDVVLHS